MIDNGIYFLIIIPFIEPCILSTLVLLLLCPFYLGLSLFMEYFLGLENPPLLFSPPYIGYVFATEFSHMFKINTSRVLHSRIRNDTTITQNSVREVNWIVSPGHGVTDR